jgi:hypothetical protein
MDPRAAISESGLKLQHDIGVRMNDAITRDFLALQEVRARRAVLKTQRQGAKAGELADSLVALDSTLAGLEAGTSGGAAAGLAKLNGDLATILDIVESADAEPTTQTVAAAADLERSLNALLTQWSNIQRSRIGGTLRLP